MGSNPIKQVTKLMKKELLNIKNAYNNRYS
jgi:hypothetical protein